MMGIRRSVAAVMACLLPLHANAAYECNVKVKSVLVYSNGLLNVLHSGRGDYTFLCSLNAEYGGASPVVCASWFAMLEHIKKKDGNANFYYPGTGSCETLPTYGNAPVPTYVGDVTP